MPNTPRLAVDRWSEVWNLLRPYANEEFYDFGEVKPVAGTIYIVGRQNLLDNMERFRDMAESGQYVMIFGNNAEGSWTLESQIRQLRLHDLAAQHKVLLLGGAAVTDQYACLVLDHFLTHILDYPENVAAQTHTESIFSQHHKPYKFLFLNGRARPHRKYLYERLNRAGLLTQSLYTMLDSRPSPSRYFNWQENDINIMSTPSPLTRLPDRYEVARYRDPVFGPIVTDNTFLKQELFRREWGEIYLEPAPYVDTYFSLVSETVCAESDISFRTEKIAKPLVMGHPFLVAANRGFYRDLRELGFQTFNHVIDESFDSIDGAQQRLDRIVAVVQDLCQQDLVSFLGACEHVCKYNQQQLSEFTQTARRQFPARFFRFISDHERS